jgi:hypothetical protein
MQRLDEVEETEAAFDPGFVASEHGGDVGRGGVRMGLREAADLSGFVAWVGVLALEIFNDEETFDLGVGEVVNIAFEFLAIDVGSNPAAFSGTELVVAGFLGVRAYDGGMNLAKFEHGSGKSLAALPREFAIVRMGVDESGGNGLAGAGG